MRSCLQGDREREGEVEGSHRDSKVIMHDRKVYSSGYPILQGRADPIDWGNQVCKGHNDRARKQACIVLLVRLVSKCAGRGQSKCALARQKGVGHWMSSSETGNVALSKGLEIKATYPNAAGKWNNSPSNRIGELYLTS